MKHTQEVPCPNCHGRGEIVGDDNDMVVCGVCMGMRLISVDLPPTIPAIPEEAWYRDPQPIRLSRSEL
jgi:DnaJ-class molecular chaperone